MKYLWITMCAALLFIACSDPTTPTYVVKGTRPLLLTVTPPDVAIGEQCSARLYVGGRTVDQKEGPPVYWFSPDTSPLPYNQPLTVTVTEELLSNLPESSGINTDVLLDSLEQNGYTDVPFFAMIKLDKEMNEGHAPRTIAAEKRFRLRKKPPKDRTFYRNPEIDAVVFSFFTDRYHSRMLTNGDTVTFYKGSVPDYIGLMVAMAVPPEEYEARNIRLVYRWFVTPDKKSDADVWPKVSYNAETAGQLFPGGVNAVGANQPHLLLSLQSIKEELRVSASAFSIYLTVQDKTMNGEKDDYRFGATFFSLTLEIK